MVDWKDIDGITRTSAAGLGDPGAKVAEATGGVTGTIAVTNNSDTAALAGAVSARNIPVYAVPLVPLYWADNPDHRFKIAQALNSALSGKTNNTKSVTLTPNATTTVINHPSIGVYSFIEFMPETSNAAVEKAAGTMYVSSRGTKTATITHANNAQTDRHFTYIVTA